MRYPTVNNKHFSSLRNALRLLNLFSKDEPEFNLSEFAERLEIGLSTAFRLTNTLVEEGFIVRDPHTKLYRPAASILAMGNTIISKIDLCQISKPILEKLVEDTGETSHIAVIRDYQVLYLLKIDNSHPVHLLSHAGKSNPLHCTSTGQVLLAYQPESVINQVIDRGLKSYTPKTITDPIRLREILYNIRKQGFSVSLEELHNMGASIAAPVKNRNGEVIASISIAGPTSRINLKTIPRLTKLVQTAAERISKELPNN
ncbi:IclR family transcriptional regulator [Niallia oryzisoli]|uniref:IclR family transcriptional regulator n=1 Tax=Niallia oryzisoli TaxID=1737571 RepID=A0ABZ2CIB5_9BACI